MNNFGELPNEKFLFSATGFYRMPNSRVKIVGIVKSGQIQKGNLIVALDSNNTPMGWHEIESIQTDNTQIRVLRKGQRGELIFEDKFGQRVQYVSTLINRDEDGGLCHFDFELNDFIKQVEKGAIVGLDDSTSDFEMVELHEIDLTTFVETNSYITESVRKKFFFLSCLYALFFLKRQIDSSNSREYDEEEISKASQIAFEESSKLEDENEEFYLAKVLSEIAYCKYVHSEGDRLSRVVNKLPSSCAHMKNTMISPRFWDSICNSFRSLLDMKAMGHSVDAELSESEKEYIYELKECLAEGEIGSRERRLLNIIREKLGLSLKRAIELEESITAPKLTEDEQEYLKEYKECAIDGIVSDKERRLLDKVRKMLGISEERAAEIEKLIK